MVLKRETRRRLAVTQNGKRRQGVVLRPSVREGATSVGSCVMQCEGECAGRDVTGVFSGGALG